MQPPLNRERERLFALILTQHRRWGSVLMPCILERLPGREYYTMAESLSPFPDSVTLSGLDNEEREVVRLLNEYSDRHLHKLFSKKRTVREFIDSVTDREFEKLIKPYIESRIRHSLHIAHNEEIPLYLQKKITTIHPEDRLSIELSEAKPVFRFDRSAAGTSYSLLVESAGKPLDLRKPVIEILSNKPCVIRTGYTIHFISDIEGAKLKPFLTREKISIPRETEEKYFSTFVLSVVNSHKVTGTGFTLRQSEPARHAFLTIEKNISGIPAAILKFRYDDKDIFYPDDLSHFTSFSSIRGEFVFTRKERDQTWEKDCISALDEAGLFTEDGITFMTPGARDENGGAMYDLIEAIAYNRTRLEKAGFIIRPGSLDQPYSLVPVEIRLSHQLINDWFDLKAVVQIGQFSIPFTRFRRNILAGNREYILPDGGVAVLPEEWFARYRDLFEMGKDNDDSLLLHKQHFGILSEVVTGDDCDICQTLGKLTMPRELPRAPAPEGLKAELRPYQLEGLNWLWYLQSNNLGGCLADDMGLGKTLQTLALLLLNKEQGYGNRESVPGAQATLFSDVGGRATSLIIVPASLCHNWYNEIRKFCPPMKTLIHHGAGRHRAASYFAAYDIIISSYHTVRQDIEFFIAMNFFYVVLDESQHIKNPSSNIYRAVTRLRSDHRLVLSGTPVENSLTDLWTQLSFVNPGLLGSLTFFRREFARPIEKNSEEGKENRLRKIIQPFIMRRTKEMVVSELPPVTEQVIHCDMSEEQAVVYEREKSAVRNSILENIEAVGIEKSAIMVLQGLMRLRQLANHPVLTDEAYSGGSGKFDAVTYNIESVISEGHKILIFSSFVKHLDLFPGWLERNGIGYAMLTGSTRDRERVIDSFRNNDNIKVFLISLKAGGVGLNLTEADYVFIIDPWWNPASEIQALSRAHRIGQEKRVFVHRYISGDTIEEKIQRLQERKSRLAGSFIDSNNPFGELDVKEMLEILN
ncbi:MAG: DEAD/DEAH box helicase [Bacteroidales bacterium]